MENKVLILVRHAKALDRTVAFSQGLDEAERPVTVAGKKEFAKFAQEYKKIFRKTHLLLTSPYLRAVDTTKILQKKTSLKKLDFQITKDCTPNSPPKRLMIHLSKLEAEKIVVVSHEPFISRLVGLLLGQKKVPFEIKKGAIIVFHFKNDKIALHSLLNP